MMHWAAMTLFSRQRRQSEHTEGQALAGIPKDRVMMYPGPPQWKNGWFIGRQGMAPSYSAAVLFLAMRPYFDDTR
jgi:hypothetical protein